MIDFHAIADAALANAESQVRSWLSDGKRNGNEWLARNPTRADGKPGSFSVNLQTGRWADFATGDKGGDLVSLLAYLKGCSQKEAAEALKHEMAMPETRRKPFRRSQVSTPATVRERPLLAKIPAPTLVPDLWHPQRGEPTANWAYQNVEGVVIGYACRFDQGNGEKEVLPLSWTGTAWKWRSMPEPRPLFNLPEISARSATVVVVAEGEKAATAVSRLLPEAVATTWPGGCKAWKCAEWGALAGRKVILWPDADEPGSETMKAIKAHLLEIGAARVKLPVLPDGLPNGWDAADALEEGFDRTEVLSLLGDRFTGPLGLCPLCWRNGIAAPAGGPTCTHSNFQWPQWTPAEIHADERIEP